MELEISRDRKMLIRVAKNLKNARKLKILLVLTSKPESLTELFDKLKREMKYKDHLYRCLEDMVEAEMVEKEYDRLTKRITYRLRIENITIRFT